MELSSVIQHNDIIFDTSPDAGHPDCICSRCEQPIEEEADFIRVAHKEIDIAQSSPRITGEYRICSACLSAAGFAIVWTNPDDDVLNAKRFKIDDPRTCRECGCTDTNACQHPTAGNCWWVDLDLCSHCQLYPGQAIKPVVNAIQTTHGLDFNTAPWNSRLAELLGIDIEEGWLIYQVGTCEGQWRCTEDAYEILSVTNKRPGNGHLEDVFEWFDYSCNRDKKKLRILELSNKKFKLHLIVKRGFTDIGNNAVEKTFEI